MKDDPSSVTVRQLASEPPRPIITKAVELGVGSGAHAWLEIQRAPLTWGETLRGDVVLQGGRVSHRITAPVEVRLGYTQDEVVRTLASQILQGAPHTLQPGASERFPFQLLVSNATPLWREVWLGCGFVFGKWRQDVGLRIRVLPPKACSEISAQFCEIAGMQLNYFEMTAPGDVCVHLKALNRRSLFTEAHLELSSGTGRWAGRLHVSKRHPWWLYVDEGQIDIPPFPQDPNEIRDHLFHLLRRAGFRPGVVGNLPLPAGVVGTGPEELPIPVERQPPSPLSGPDDLDEG